MPCRPGVDSPVTRLAGLGRAGVARSWSESPGSRTGYEVSTRRVRRPGEPAGPVRAVQPAQGRPRPRHLTRPGHPPATRPPGRPARQVAAGPWRVRCCRELTGSGPTRTGSAVWRPPVRRPPGPGPVPATGPPVQAPQGTAPARPG